MIGYKRTPALCAATLLALGGAVQAAAVDPAGDFLPTYSGPHGADLDVLSVSAVYHPHTHSWELDATLAGPVGTTPGGFYVWGVNRGSGSAGFAASLGLTGVLFDTVAVIRPNGASTIAGNALPAGSVTFSGNTLSIDFDEALLPTLNLFAPAQYTWNLWPRTNVNAPAGPPPVGNSAQIADFAPDNSNFATLVVPEPASALLLALGFGALATATIRRRRA